MYIFSLLMATNVNGFHSLSFIVKSTHIRGSSIQYFQQQQQQQQQQQVDFNLNGAATDDQGGSSLQQQKSLRANSV